MTGLTPQISATLLKGTCSQVGPVSFVKFHREGHSGGEFLGAASVGFKRQGDGETAVELLRGFHLQGCTLKVELDDQGTHRTNVVLVVTLHGLTVPYTVIALAW